VSGERRRRSRIAATTLLCLGMSAVPENSARDTNARETPRGSPHLTTPYPRGRWRLAPHDALGRTAISFAHILVRHSEVSTQAPFGPPDWNALPAAPQRTRIEAFHRARELAQTVRQPGNSFERVAAATSDDTLTAGLGGSLGIVTASSLLPHPEVLDAIAALRLDEASEPIETPFGFHIITPRALPAEQRIGAKHVVIGYAEAPWLGLFHRGERRPARTRAEAFALAWRIASSARLDASSFDSLVASYSEHEDFINGGDIGVWSSNEPGEFGRERALLASVKVGTVTDPVDSHMGFQVFLRTPADTRPLYAVQAIRIAYDDSAPTSDPNSKAAARALAASLAGELREHPQEFDAIRRRLCCPDTLVWSDGRVRPALGRAVALLDVNSISPEPVDIREAFVLVKRVGPEAFAPAPALTELPAPSRPDAFAFAERVSGPGVQKAVVFIRDHASERLRLTAAQVEEFRLAHEEVIPAFARDGRPQDRKEALRHLRDRLERILSPTQREAYADFVSDVVVDRYLHQ